MPCGAFEFTLASGFVCPSCKNTTYCELKRHHLFQCNKCHTQTSITSGTIFHATKIALSIWFLAIYIFTLRGTYHSIRDKHVPRYLAEFEYRFNRRYKLEDMIPRLAYIALRTPPIPMKILTMAEIAW